MITAVSAPVADRRARERAPCFGLSSRDGRILALTRKKVDGVAVDFGEVLRALRDAVEESIPAGRVFLLGTAQLGPIVGSIISGIGVVDDPDGVRIVRVHYDGRIASLAPLFP
jgi:hypothetical protein